jgi:O-antigen ligase
MAAVLAVLALVPFGAARNSSALVLVICQASLLIWVLSRPWAPAVLVSSLGRIWPSAALFIAAIAYGLWSLAVPLGPLDRYQHGVELIKLGGGSCALLTGLVLGASRRRYRRLETLLGLMLTLYLLVALVSFAVDSDTVLGELKTNARNRLTGTLVSPNSAAMVCIVALMSGLAGLFGHAQQDPGVPWVKRLWRLVHAAPVQTLTTALAVTALILTNSRSGLALAGIGSAAACLAVLVVRRWQRPRRLAKTIALILVLGATSLALDNGRLGDRLGRLDDDTSTRIAIWTDHAAQAAQRFQHGWGLGSFTLVNDKIGTDDNFARLGELRAAHNLALQVIEEGGLAFGLLMGGAVAGLLGLAWVTGVKSSQSGPSSRLFLASAASLLLAQSLFDYGLNIPALTNLWLLSLGLAASQPPQRDRHRRRPREGDPVAGPGRAGPTGLM